MSGLNKLKHVFVFIWWFTCFWQANGGLGDETEYGLDTIKIGLLGASLGGSPYDYEKVVPAAEIGVEYVNEYLLKEWNKSLELIARNYGDECGAGAAAFASELYLMDGVRAIIGPQCTDALHVTSQMASIWNIAVVTGGGVHGTFSVRKNYPNLARLSYCQCKLRHVIASVCKKFGWTDVTLIYDASEEEYNDLAARIEHGMRMYSDIFVRMQQLHGFSLARMKQNLVEAAEESRGLFDSF